MKQENTIAVAMKSGFTLVEILVVVFIIGILAMMAVVSLSGVSDSAAEDTCKASLKTIHGSVEMYKNYNKGRRPQTIEDLLKENERGQAVFDSRDFITDPWGTLFKLEYKNNKVIVISAGPDCSFGTEDDLRFPEEKKN